MKKTCLFRPKLFWFQSLLPILYIFRVGCHPTQVGWNKLATLADTAAGEANAAQWEAPTTSLHWSFTQACHYVS